MAAADRKQRHLTAAAVFRTSECQHEQLTAAAVSIASFPGIALAATSGAAAITSVAATC